MRTILLILASEDLRLLLGKILQKDYSVSVCGDASAGADLLQQRPDAMVLDLFLPGTDGLTFLEENQSLLPPVVMVLTQYLNSELLQELYDIGVDYVFMKPCSHSAIVKKLVEYLK